MEKIFYWMIKFNIILIWVNLKVICKRKAIIRIFQIILNKNDNHYTPVRMAKNQPHKTHKDVE